MFCFAGLDWELGIRNWEFSGVSLEKIKSDRLEKLEAIKKAGINPYPAKSGARINISWVLENFNDLTKQKKEISLVGRLLAIRAHGGSTFVNLQDGSAQIQVYFKKDQIGERDYKFFTDNFNVGDFIWVGGSLFKTQKGERTLLVKKYKILAKALNQLPEKWHGLKDVEERFRKRYLDLLMDREVRQRFEKRSQIIKKLRQFFEKEGFMEVETPVLQSLPGGALARPFKTHLNALNVDLYLRVSPELYLKRLLIGGFEKVYEIGKCFRNEGMDKLHNPDFTILEFYWAYADYDALISLTEKMFEFLISGKEAEFQGQKIKFAAPFARISLRDLITKYCQIDIYKAKVGVLIEVLEGLGEKPEKKMPACKLVDEIFKAIRPKIIQPTFVTGHLLEMSPLAKASEQNPKEAARFQLVAAGIELVNAYSELNDPKEQAARMKEQERHRDEEMQRYDQDFIEALEYGMPPAAGLGLGIDRLVQLLTNSASIREVILFPTMKPK